MKNEEKFTGKAGIYDKYRPTYPDELIDYLYSHIGFDEKSIIADIGSGTGKLSKPLLERGSFVYCVEPNDDMRLTAEKALSGFDKYISINASAENTLLQDKSIDFVIAAQAFHWFDKLRFRQECRRLLKEKGKVVIIWNTRDVEHDITKRENGFRINYSPDTSNAGLRDGGNFVRDWSGFFTDGICMYKTCRNDLALTRESYIGVNTSRSWSPDEKKDPEKYHGFINELNKLFDEYSVDGILKSPYFTQCYAGSV